MKAPSSATHRPDSGGAKSCVPMGVRKDFPTVASSPTEGRAGVEGVLDMTSAGYGTAVASPSCWADYLSASETTHVDDGYRLTRSGSPTGSGRIGSLGAPAHSGILVTPKRPGPVRCLTIGGLICLHIAAAKPATGRSSIRRSSLPWTAIVARAGSSSPARPTSCSCRRSRTGWLAACRSSGCTR